MLALLWGTALLLPAAAAPSPIGFIGDSITHSTLLPERTPEVVGQILGVPVMNRGIGGTTTADWLPSGRLLAPAIAAFRAAGVHIVQVALGTNDAATGVPAPSFRAHLARIVAALRHAGFRVIPQRPPFLVAGSMQGYVTAAAAARLASYGTGLAWTYFRAHPDQLQDGVHPNPEGSIALARIWAAELH